MSVIGKEHYVRLSSPNFCFPFQKHESSKVEVVKKKMKQSLLCWINIIVSKKDKVLFSPL